MFREIEKSQTLLLNEQSRNLESGGKTMYKFGFGQSPFLPPEPAMHVLAESAHRKEYAPVQGMPELRENVAAFHTELDGFYAKADDTLIAPGSKSLLYNTMLAFEDAHILIPAPAWVSYAPQAKLIGHAATRLNSSYKTRWRVTPDMIEDAVQNAPAGVKNHLLILNYPGNPEGLSYTEDELKALADVLRKHGVWVLADEIYGLLHHQGEHKCLANYYPERTTTTTGLSKWAGAGGWRLGVQFLPEGTAELKECLLGIASETYSCAPTPVQVAACEAYKWNDYTKSYVEHQRKIFTLIGNWCHSALQEAGVNVHAPEGGFYLLLDFSPFADKLRAKSFNTDQDFCADLMDKTGAAILPGGAFGLDVNGFCARFAYINFDGDTALKASQAHGGTLDHSFMEQYAPSTIEGVNQIVNYLNTL